VIPLRDENPTSRPPVVTVLLIAACAAVFFLIQPARAQIFGHAAESDTAFTVEHAAIPCEIVQGHPLTVRELDRTFGPEQNADACETNDATRAGFPAKQVYLALLVSMFMHAGLLHIGGNMLFLWVFGNNIEDRLGPVGFLAFYLIGGLIASLGHVFADPNSTIPVVGASGAIAAVMGAYLVLFPRARVHSLIFLGFFVFFRPLPAWLLLGFWFISQFAVDPSSGVAWVAHVTGFAFGVVAGLILRATRPVPPRLVTYV
jgi:membrane associated rhomboid family serine protease